MTFLGWFLIVAILSAAVGVCIYSNEKDEEEATEETAEAVKTIMDYYFKNEKH